MGAQDRQDEALDEPEREPGDSLGALLQQRCRRQIVELREQGAAVRAGSDDGVHRMRIAARRLRSALTTCKPLFEEPPEDLRRELRWLGRVLGPARDCQVLRERLETALEAEPSELVAEATRSRLRLELGRQHRRAQADIREALDSVRYDRLLDALDALAADPPMAPAADLPACAVLGDLVRRDAKRLRRAVRAVSDSDADGRDQALHEVRKKAKRLRYAAELAVPAGGRRAGKLVKRAKAVHQALGRHQDSVVARQHLRRLGALSVRNGEDAFTFGVLYGVERRRAQQAEQEFRTAWARMPAPRRAAAWVSEH